MSHQAGSLCLCLSVGGKHGDLSLDSSTQIKSQAVSSALGERRKGRDRGFLGAVAALLVHKPVRDVPRWNKMENG